MPKRNDPAAQLLTATLDWRAAWEEHRGWLRTVVWARLGKSHEVEEVLQEVALAAASEKGLRTVRDATIDRRIPSSFASAVPDSFRRRLERLGYQVDTRRRYAPIPLQGGRRMYVPVEDTRIVPVNLTVY